MTKKIETSVEKVSKEVSKVAEDVKETVKDVDGRWKRSSLEEKITTILGIILVARALWHLRAFIRGILLLILGGLLVSGYFNKGLKEILKSIGGEKKGKAKKAKETV